MATRRSFFLFLASLTVFFGCATHGSQTTGQTVNSTPSATSTVIGTPTAQDFCPGAAAYTRTCLTPHSLRLLYGVAPLLQHGFTGKGQTIIDIVSYGSPTLQADLDVFSQQFGLPSLTVSILAPLGTIPFDSMNSEMTGWAGETTIDVEIIHAIAPEANIVVLTSPVDETEGTAGLPEFQQLEQYVIDHQLGQIVSMSWGASEYSLNTNDGHALAQQFSAFFQQNTLQHGITFLASSGDNGAADIADPQGNITPGRSSSFPADSPWVTACGGTTLDWEPNGQIRETAWSFSGGGTSMFFPIPDYQATLPTATKALLGGQRGIPDVAADANTGTGLAVYINGLWSTAGGTSASSPLWAALVALGNQMAGKPLGFLNPLLYKLGAAPSYAQDFRDITVGNNTYHDIQGFAATPGWDLVTGWGAPIASSLLPALVKAAGSPLP